jgi:hypothetical protein
MKKVLLVGMLLGLMSGVGFAQRGRAGGAVSPTARPDVDMTARRTLGASPTMVPNRTTVNRGVSPTLAPIKDPAVTRSATIGPNATTVNRNVDPTVAPVKDPLIGIAPTTAGSSTTVNRGVSPTAAAPIRDPK